MRRSLRWLGSCVFLVTVFSAPVAHASPIQITVNTSSLAGTSAALAFDLIDGGLPANAVTISGFTTDGTLGISSTTGDVTGSFPGSVILSDTSFFNEYLQSITLGDSLSFIFDTTGSTADPASFPDAFSPFLLDPLTGLSLVTTSDPTGADTLLLFNIGEANPLTIYTAQGVTVSTGRNLVPEPRTLVLVVTALALFALTGFLIARRRSKSSLALPT